MHVIFVVLFCVNVDFSPLVLSVYMYALADGPLIPFLRKLIYTNHGTGTFRKRYIIPAAAFHGQGGSAPRSGRACYRRQEHARLQHSSATAAANVTRIEQEQVTNSSYEGSYSQKEVMNDPEWKNSVAFQKKFWRMTLIKKNKLERLLLYCVPCQEILLGQPRPLHGLSPCPHRHAS